MSERQRVQVLDAPGYQDFEGELVMQVSPGGDDGNLSFILAEWEGRTVIEVIPSKYIHPVTQVTD